MTCVQRMKQLILNPIKNSAITSFLLVTTLVALSHTAIHNASKSLDSAPRNLMPSHLLTKLSSLSETEITSTVRPWPSHKFFKGVLSQSNQKHVKQKQNTRSHNQTSKTLISRQREKLGHHKNTIGKITAVTKNETVHKGKEHTRFTINPSEIRRNFTTSIIKEHEKSSISKQTSSTTISSIKKTIQILPQTFKKGYIKSKIINETDGNIFQVTISKPFIHMVTKQSLNPTQIVTSKIAIGAQNLTKSNATTSTGSYKKRQKYFPAKILKDYNNELKGSKRTMMTVSQNDESFFKGIRNDQVVLPYTVSRTTNNSPSIRNPFKSQLHKIANKVNSFGNKGNDSHLKYKIRRKKLKGPTTDDQDGINDLFEWIEKDNEFSVYPSTNLPMKLRYTNKTNLVFFKDTDESENITPSSTTISEYNGAGFQYEFEFPSTNLPPTTEIILTSTKQNPVTSSWKRVPTITPHPMAQFNDKNKQSLATFHRGSSGSIVKPLRPQPHAPTPVLISTLKPTFDPTESIKQVEPHISGFAVKAVQTLPAKHLTNIWYKPIINHFSAPPSQTEATETPASDDSLQFPLIFKVWSYKNGSLKLENKKEIPAWAINGFKIMDGSVLNLDQIPEALQALVSTALVKTKKNDKKSQTRPQNSWQKNRISETLKDDYDLANEDGSALTLMGWNNSMQNKPVDVNYVIWKTDSTTFLPSLIDDSNKSQKLKIQPKITIPTPTKRPHVETFTKDSLSPVAENYLNQYLQFLTSKPPVITKAPDTDTVKDTWNKLEKLISQSLLKATPIESSSVSISKDSDPSKKTDDQELLSNLAAVAILISYMKSQLPRPPPTSTTTSPLNNPSNTPVYDFNKAMHQLFQQLLQRNDSIQSNQKVKVGEAVTDSTVHQDYESQYPIPGTTNKPSAYHDPDRLTKTLLLKGIFKKGKKKKKRLKKRRFKKKKAFFLNNIISPLAQLFKKPKNYWVDMNFDIDFHDLLKKKFLYLLAFKYAPVFFVLALGVIPLGLVIIPLLYKIYWVKKKPKYIRVPVPVPYPEAYPLHPHWHHHYNPLDLEYAADDTGISDYNEQRKPGIIFPTHENYPVNDQHIQDGTNIRGIIDHEIASANLEDYQNGNRLKPHAVNNAYDLGFDLGSKLGSITNTHDKEVLQILIDNKKKKINDLLEKWKLLHQGKSVSMFSSLNDFENIDTSKAKRRRKRRSKLY